ncbi:MAG: M56 family metallopeptidase [Thermoleophilaceae bacterium]|nr:M56 family metallopeptidase [Thermoleophilaceae bacterium]
MARELVLAVTLAGGVALPHALPLQAVSPLLASTIWLLALALRALIAAGGAIFVFVYLPQTRLFEVIGDWCLHEVVPLLAMHLGFSGHPVAHAVVVVPALALAASLLWALVGLARGWLSLRRLLDGSAGEGPWGSTLVPDDRVVVAATALGRGRIILSSAAVGNLDKDELRAGLAHEMGHLRRRHRPLSLLASVLAAVAFPLPGTRRAERELAFQLERDADEYAVRETRDPLALASAICKAAQSQLPEPAYLLAGRGRIARRLDILVYGAARRSRPAQRVSCAAAVLLAAIVLGLGATLPSWALTPNGAHAATTAHCLG